MGILNVTPDSFSDGGRYADVSSAIERGCELAALGAHIIDVGGESTRPGSDAVTVADELARVVPVVSALVGSLEVPISVDTRHAEVAAACVAAGASIVNDISGFEDPAMIEVATSGDAGLVVMHMLGEPKTMQEEPRYEDVTAEVCAYLATQARMLEDAGVASGRIALDPGIGFGKTTAHNLEVLRHLEEFISLGYPLLVGASRKRFIGELTGVMTPARRVSGSVAVACWSVLHGADIVRVHDVAPTLEALAMFEALGNDDVGSA
ncbi:MAG: dihydropteroate synthase [Coriobacteriia bacterium]|nr:dihydropteroate synthase [Coriobacteriia bacterium]